MCSLMMASKHVAAIDGSKINNINKNWCIWWFVLHVVFNCLHSYVSTFLWSELIKRKNIFNISDGIVCEVVIAWPVAKYEFSIAMDVSRL
jgi:hypothetical protein